MFFKTSLIFLLSLSMFCKMNSMKKTDPAAAWRRLSKNYEFFDPSTEDTALHKLVNHGKKELINNFLNKLPQDFDINLMNKNGDSALHLAAFNPNGLAALELLLTHTNSKNKIDVNLINPRGNTPLILAAMRGYVKSVNLLLGSGADHTVINKKGKSAYSSAYRDIRIIIERHNRVKTAIDKFKAMYSESAAPDSTFCGLMCKRENSDELSFMYEVDKKTGNTLLHDALLLLNRNFINSLLDVRLKFNILQKNIDGHSALALALKLHNLQLVTNFLGHHYQNYMDENLGRLAAALIEFHKVFTGKPAAFEQSLESIVNTTIFVE